MASSLSSAGAATHEVSVDILDIFLSQNLKFETSTLYECRDLIILFGACLLSVISSSLIFGQLRRTGIQQLLDAQGLQAHPTFSREIKFLRHYIGTLVILIKWGFKKWESIAYEVESTRWMEWIIKYFWLDWRWWGCFVAAFFFYLICLVGQHWIVRHDEWNDGGPVPVDRWAEADDFAWICMERLGEGLDWITKLMDGLIEKIRFRVMMTQWAAWDVQNGTIAMDENDEWIYPE